MVLGVWVRPALVGLFGLYLSYVYAGQTFTSYQWDLLLRESGFLALFLHHRFPHRDLALSLARLPLTVPIGRREAAVRATDLARPDGPRVPLLDPAAANAARVVCGATPVSGSRNRDRRDPHHRTSRRLPHLPPRRLRAAAAWCIYYSSSRSCSPATTASSIS